MKFQEGTTALLGGAKLPAGGLCARVFRVQFSAKNAAGYGAVVTTSATFNMPACPGDKGEEWQREKFRWSFTACMCLL